MRQRRLGDREARRLELLQAPRGRAQPLFQSGHLVRVAVALGRPDVAEARQEKILKKWDILGKI